MTEKEQAKFTELENLLASVRQQLSDKSEGLTQAYASRDLYVQENAKLKEDTTQLREQLAQVTAERDQAQATAEEATTTADQLSEALTEAQAQATAAGAKPRVKHEGKTYEVVAGRFRHQGRVYEAAEVQEGSQVLRDLVALNSGVLEEVTA